MKVLIGIPCLMNGGTEVQTLSLVQALVASGHRPVVTCYFEYAPQMVKNYEESGAKVILFSQDGKRHKGLLNKIKFLRRNFQKVIKAEKPEVAHVQYMAPGALPIVLLRLLGIKKIIATTHTDGNIYGKNGLKIIRFLTKYILSGFQTITLKAENSYFGSSSLFNNFLNSPNFPNFKLKGTHFTIYNSLPSHINIRKNPKFLKLGKVEADTSEKVNKIEQPFQETKTPTLTIGVVSRLETIKGMDLVIPAFAKVLEKLNSLNFDNFLNSERQHNFHNFPKSKLLVVGDGSLRESMERQASEVSSFLSLKETSTDSSILPLTPPNSPLVPSHITFTGRKSQSELQDIYDQIDILLMPSRSEGFGLTAIEGMARGCVPVVADTGGLPEVVTPDSGLLHKPEDIDDLADKILSLIQDPNLLSRLSQGAIERAKDFSQENYQKQIKKLYELVGGVKVNKGE